MAPASPCSPCAGALTTRAPTRRVKTGPLLLAVLACVLFAVLGGALVGESLGSWYAELRKPWFLVPLPVFYLVGAIYYVVFAVVLYRILALVYDRRAKMVCLSLALVVMLSNELWNFFFFGLRSTFAGFAGVVVFLAPLTALLLALYRHERPSATILVPYYAWVLYDVAWTYGLWRLNGA